MLKVIIGAIIVVIVGAGSYLYYKSSQEKLATPPKETAITTVTKKPTPSPTPNQVAVDEYSIEILNGSGIAGEAGRAQALLENSDYIIDSIGNAEKYDYGQTVIQAGADVPKSWIDALKSVLEEKYDVKARAEEIDDAEAVVVIIGSFDKNGDSMVVEEVVDKDASEVAVGDLTPTEEITPSPTP
ncbi:hypothetical protein COY14_03215 [Candidatus Roizmanbacteria bacterium CG_4_10_14_0_2_um_filter_36_9]|uniref:LytR/CpsA/Psr regulator C-terminal domain-containing protein n=3 Tax=Candidatus Roizmaniibacteriota TaxID=1752723 RepID=A0A2M7U3I7_9BACT|nr:MAG: hypothetical protein COY14_03215 [Candidatus Roizmanbacteria bacterium CG_4_10_14_0_2_um_filter_36_9]